MDREGPRDPAQIGEVVEDRLADRVKRLFWLSVLISLFLHVVIVVVMAVLDSGLLSIPLEKPLEVFFPDQQKTFVDQVEAPNQKRPAKSKHYATQDNTATEETTAIPTPPSQTPKKQASQSVPKTIGSGKERLYAVDPRLFGQKRDEMPVPKKRDDTAGQYNMKPSLTVPEDFLHDYRVGAHTYISAQRHPDAEFVVRMMRVFKMTWNPVPSLYHYFTSGGSQRPTVASVLGMTVSPTGELTELFVIRTSGIGSYDEEALRTIRASAPFTRPPDSFIKDGGAHLAWTFITYIR